jgi:BlaI family penicillinase repressor
LKINLPDSEWKIMAMLWEGAPKTITQLTALQKDTTGWTKHTVITFLKRLEEKGAVHHIEGKKAKLFYPDVLKEDAELQKSEEFLNKVFNGHMGLMLNTMISQKALNTEEIKELYEILKKAEGKYK